MQMQSKQISLDEGVEVDVVEDAADSRMFVTGATVSASEKISTGDYENYNPHATAQATFRPAFPLTGNEQELQQALLDLHREVNSELQQMISNRLSEPGFENWEAGAGENR